MMSDDVEQVRRTLDEINVLEGVSIKRLAQLMDVDRSAPTTFMQGRTLRLSPERKAKGEVASRVYSTPEPANFHKMQRYLALRALTEAAPAQGAERRAFAKVLAEWVAKGRRVEMHHWGITIGDRSYLRDLTQSDYEAFAPVLATDSDRDELFDAIAEAERLRQWEDARQARKK